MREISWINNGRQRNDLKNKQKERERENKGEVLTINGKQWGNELKVKD